MCSLLAVPRSECLQTNLVQLFISSYLWTDEASCGGVVGPRGVHLAPHHSLLQLRDLLVSLTIAGVCPGLARLVPVNAITGCGIHPLSYSEQAAAAAGSTTLMIGAASRKRIMLID